MDDLVYGLLHRSTTFQCIREVVTNVRQGMTLRHTLDRRGPSSKFSLT